MPAKTKGVAHCHIDLPFLRFVESEVDVWIDIFIIREMVDCRRDDVVLDRQNGRNCFNHTSSTQQMPGHGLCRIDIHLV